MFLTIRGLLEERGVKTENSAYRDCSDGLLDFKITTGDFYEMPYGDEGYLRFKNTADVMSFEQLAAVLEKMNGLRFNHREDFPYYCENIEIIKKALAEDPDSVCVEGGPCLFSDYEVMARIKLRDGEELLYDFTTGKRYKDGSETELAEGPNAEFADFLDARAGEIADLNFYTVKPDITYQEYMHVLLPFVVADALDVPLVISLPDMSYRKELHSMTEHLEAEVRDKARDSFDSMLNYVTDMYLRLIERLNGILKIEKLTVFHSRDEAVMERFEEARRPYIERNKILRGLTDNMVRIEAIKDYISMPALPLYVYGSTTIIEVNSVVEIDSYRKCRKAHKGAATFCAILFSEMLSRDGENVNYTAPVEYKEYGHFRQEL